MKHAVKNVTERKFRALCTQWGSPDDIPTYKLSEKQAETLCDADRDYADAWDVEDAVKLLREWQLL